MRVEDRTSQRRSGRGRESDLSTHLDESRPCAQARGGLRAGQLTALEHGPSAGEGTGLDVLSCCASIRTEEAGEVGRPRDADPPHLLEPPRVKPPACMQKSHLERPCRVREAAPSVRADPLSLAAPLEASRPHTLSRAPLLAQEGSQRMIGRTGSRAQPCRAALIAREAGPSSSPTSPFDAARGPGSAGLRATGSEEHKEEDELLDAPACDDGVLSTRESLPRLEALESRRGPSREARGRGRKAGASEPRAS